MSRKAALILLTLLGMALLWGTLRQFGAGLTPDSVGYISVARSLANGEGFRLADGTLLINQPPLYSLLLALGATLVRVDPLAIAPLLNVLLFGATIWLSGQLSVALIDSTKLVLLATAAVAVSVPLVNVTLMAWSEPLFITLLTAGVVLALRYRKRPTRSRLIGWALVVTLATLTRYAGIALIGAGVGTIALGSGISVRRRVRDVLLFALIAAAPLTVWMLHNRSVSGTLTGDRSASDISLWQNLDRSAAVVGAWFAPGTEGSMLPTLALAVLAWLVIGWSWRRDGGAWLRAAAVLWSPVCLVAAGYAVFLILTATFTGLDSLDDRLWSPVAVPLILLVAALLERLGQLVAGGAGTARLPRALAIVMLLWLLLPLHASYAMVTQYLEDGGSGFGDRSWRESETLAYLRDHPAECYLYSNEPEAITILTGFPAELSPLKSEHGSTGVIPLPLVWPSERKACLVWFTQESWDALWPIDALRGKARLVLVRESGDGRVFRLNW